MNQVNFNSVILGALTVTVLSTSYLGLINLLCCLGFIGGILVTIWHATEEGGVQLNNKQGALSGGLTAVLAALLVLTLDKAILPMLGIPTSEEVIQQVITQAVSSSDEQLAWEMQEQIETEKALQEQNGVGSFAFIGAILFNGIFGAIVGMVGTKIFGRNLPKIEEEG